ncbi:MAG: TonB-dependent receptor plug domain-containing protein [Burkholderiales bacterium]
MSIGRRRVGRAVLALTVALAVAGFPCRSSHAQLRETDAERAFFEDMPRVLSASRLPTRLADAPGAVTVIDREMILASGYRNIADLFRLVPGFNVAWFRGWWPTVNYHGLSGEFAKRVLVFVDGRAINTEFNESGVFFGLQPLAVDDIDRIEVLRGTNSAAYGTNAFLGVINVITRHATDTRGVYAEVRRGEAGINDKIMRFGSRLGPADYRLTIGQTKDAGLPNLVDSSRYNFINFRSDIRLSLTDELGVQLGHSRGAGDEGSPYEIGNPVRPVKTDVSFQQIGWRRTLSVDDEINVRIARSDNRWLESAIFDLPFPPPLDRVPFEFKNRSTRDSLGLQHQFRWSPDVRLAWGAEARWDATESRLLYGDTQPRRANTQQLFGVLEWRATRALVLNGGAMVERVSLVGTDVAPRAFANYELARDHVVRAGYSSGTRAPTLFNTYAQRWNTEEGLLLPLVIVGNTELRRERLAAREVGYFGRFPVAKLQLDIRAYDERIKDLIDEREVTLPVPPGLTTLPIPTQYLTYENIGTARLRGGEFEARLSPWSSTQIHMGHSLQSIRHSDTAQAHSAPRKSTSLMWIQQLPASLRFTLTQYWIDPIRWVGFGEEIKQYRRTDARLAYHFKSGALRGELALVGLNLFDRYNEFRNGYVPNEHEFDRRIYATMRVEY